MELNFATISVLIGIIGGILGILNPQVEPLEKTEQMLRQVYGNISLLRCQNRKGESQIVILKEG